MESKCLENCAEAFTYEDFYQKILIRCDDAKSIKYFNPGKLTTKNCTDYLIGSHPCDDNLVYCSNSISLAFFIIGLIIFLLSLLALVYARYKFFTISLKKKNMDLYQDKFKIYIKKGDNILIKRSIIRFILYLTLGIKLTRACLILDKHNELIATPSSTICTRFGNLTVPLMDKQLILDFTYVTADWDYKNDMTWGCGGGTCPYIEDCDELNVKETTWIGDKIYKSECNTFPKACVFGRGCIFGNHELTIYSEYNVYNLVSIKDKSTHEVHLANCSFEFYSSEEQILGSYFIIEPKKYSPNQWLCKSNYYSGVARSNLLGDLQLYNNTVLFDWDSIKCGRDWLTQDCIYPRSYISSVSYSCQTIPGYTDIGYLFKNSFGYYKKSTEAHAIHSTCPLQSIIISNISCSIISMDLWGIKQHSSGLFLNIRAISNQQFITREIINPCNLDETLIVNCDGSNNIFKISEDNYYNCANITDKTMTNSQAYIMDHHSKTSYTNIDSIIHSSNGFLSFLGLSGSSILIWLLIISILIRH